LASPHPKPGTKCPNCQGPIPDMFGEATADPAAVMAGKAGINCYYCGSPTRYEGGGLTIGGDVVPAQGVPIIPYDYSLIVSVAGTEDKWDHYFDSYAQGAGFTEAKNPAGVRAFQGYKKQKARGTNP
jgi:hypothetical protein